MKEAGDGGEGKRKGDAPQVLLAPNERRSKKKPSEGSPSA